MYHYRNSGIQYSYVQWPVPEVEAEVHKPVFVMRLWMGKIRHRFICDT